MRKKIAVSLLLMFSLVFSCTVPTAAANSVETFFGISAENVVAGSGTAGAFRTVGVASVVGAANTAGTTGTTGTVGTTGISGTAGTTGISGTAGTTGTVGTTGISGTAGTAETLSEGDFLYRIVEVNGSRAAEICGTVYDTVQSSSSGTLSPPESLTIPAKLGGVPVTSISAGAFRKLKLSAIYVDAGNSSFSAAGDGSCLIAGGTTLVWIATHRTGGILKKEVTLPEVETIAPQTVTTLSGEKLQTLRLPASLRTVEQNALYGDFGDIYIEDGLKSLAFQPNLRVDNIYFKGNPPDTFDFGFSLRFKINGKVYFRYARTQNLYFDWSSGDTTSLLTGFVQFMYYVCNGDEAAAMSVQNSDGSAPAIDAGALEEFLGEGELSDALESMIDIPGAENGAGPADASASGEAHGNADGTAASDSEHGSGENTETGTNGRPAGITAAETVSDILEAAGMILNPSGSAGTIPDPSESAGSNADGADAEPDPDLLQSGQINDEGSQQPEEDGSVQPEGGSSLRIGQADDSVLRPVKDGSVRSSEDGSALSSGDGSAQTAEGSSLQPGETGAAGFLSGEDGYTQSGKSDSGTEKENSVRSGNDDSDLSGAMDAAADRSIHDFLPVCIAAFVLFGAAAVMILLKRKK